MSEALAYADAHRFHGYGEYDFCPSCLADRKEAAEVEDQARAAEIETLVKQFADATDDAERAAFKAIQAVNGLCCDRVFDAEMVELEGGDARAELEAASRHLRNASRIAARRLDLLKASRPEPATRELAGYEDDLRPGDVIVAIQPGAGPWKNYTIRRPAENLDGSERMYGGLDYFDAKAENDAAADSNDRRDV